MSKVESKEANQDFETQCQEALEKTRKLAQSILDKAGVRYETKSPTRRWEKILDTLFPPQNTIDFDSQNHPELTLCIRAAADTRVLPRIRITAWEDEGIFPKMEIRLSGNHSETGENVDVMSIFLPKDSFSPGRASVVYWTAPLPGSRSYIEMMASNFAEINDLIINCLTTIDRNLKKS